MFFLLTTLLFSLTPTILASKVCNPTSAPPPPSPSAGFYFLASSSSPSSTINGTFFRVIPGESGDVAFTSSVEDASLFTIDPTSSRLIEKTPTRGLIANQDVNEGSYVYFNSAEVVEESGASVVGCRVDEGTCKVECDVNGGNIESWGCNERWYLNRPGVACGEMFEMVAVGWV